MNESEITRIEHENARSAHKAVNESIQTELNMVATYGNAAMRSPALAAAGGIAALLGFYSANVSFLRGTPAAEAFNEALLYFFIAILACVAAPGAAYFSQALFVSAKGASTLHFDRPFVRDTTKSKWLRRTGVVFQVAAIVLTLLSIAFLFAGGIKFIEVANFAGHAA